MKISHLMPTAKILISLCAIKQSGKIKKYVCRCCLQSFSCEKILTEQKQSLFKNKL